MSLQLQIPDTVVQAIRLPETQLSQGVLLELAIALYARGLLSYGKARELAGQSKYQFGLLLGERGVLRHYTSEEWQEDLDYADCK